MRVFKINTTSVVYVGSGAAVLARGAAVSAMSAKSSDGRTWHIYTSGTTAVAATSLQTPPNVPSSGDLVSAIFGVPQSLSTLLSVWWADGTRYYVTAAGLASDPVVYISSFTGSPVAVYAELNAPPGYSYYLGILDNGTYVWGVGVSGSSITVYVPTPGYYTVRLYRDNVKVWEKLAYLSPDARLTVGPIEIPLFTPIAPVSLYTPAAPKPPVFVPTVTMQMPPYAVGILMLGVFAAAYVSTREVSLASLITGAVVVALGVLMSAPIYGVAGVFLLAFGLWNKARRQGSI
jgi:branched-subunit amino acid transport protein AzlD